VGLPSLWLDWCAVTGHDPDERDEDRVAEFTRQAHPSRAVLRALTQPDAGHHAAPDAPAWPRDADGKPAPSLGQTLAALCWVGRDGLRTHWPHLLRARRDAYLMVLLAPTCPVDDGGGGLGLSRGAALDLAPAGLRPLRDRIQVADDPASCPACAVHRWLHVAGLYAAWSLASVRSLVNTRLDLDTHACGHMPGVGAGLRAADPEPEWETARTLLPAIDQHGAFDFWRPMSTRAVTSILALRTTEALYAAPPAAEHDREPLAPVDRHFTDDEVREVFDEADEVNARLKALLDDTEGLLPRRAKDL